MICRKTFFDSTDAAGSFYQIFKMQYFPEPPAAFRCISSNIWIQINYNCAAVMEPGNSMLGKKKELALPGKCCAFWEMFWHFQLFDSNIFVKHLSQKDLCETFLHYVSYLMEHDIPSMHFIISRNIFIIFMKQQKEGLPSGYCNVSIEWEVLFTNPIRADICQFRQKNPLNKRTTGLICQFLK